MEGTPNELAIFAGTGGGLLASKLLGWRTVCYVEKNIYAVKVIKARIRDGYLDDAPIWDDVFTFDGYPWAGLVDVITAGFPCQPFSQAGKGLSENDPRNGWPPLKRIIGEVRPKLAYLENVPGLISKPYIRRIFGELASLGYDAEWGTLSAAAVGAPHVRERLWILAYTDSIPFDMAKFSREKNIHVEGNGATLQVAHASSARLAKRQTQQGTSIRPTERTCVVSRRETHCWKVEPGVGRVVDGMANRMDRLEALGNGQVPEVARTAWELLKQRIDSTRKSEF